MNHLPGLGDFTLTPAQDQSYVTVTFSVPFRLAGHTVDVELADVLGNQGRYNLYPQGGTF